MCDLVAQWIARSTSNRKVVGSSPIWVAFFAGEESGVASGAVWQSLRRKGRRRRSWKGGGTVRLHQQTAERLFLCSARAWYRS